MAKKINPKELNQPDLLQTRLSELMQFVRIHRIRILQVSGVLVFLILLAGGVFLYEWHNDKAAYALYVHAEDTLSRTGFADASSQRKVIAAYRSLIDRYPRSPAATFARYRLGGLHYEIHQMDDVIRWFDAFIDKASTDSDLVTLAWSGKGYAYESKGDLAKALQAFEQASKTPGNGNFAGINDQNIARVYEAMNKPDRAVTYYRKALEKTIDPGLSRLLKRKIAMLG